jgi:hypothetical protein
MTFPASNKSVQTDTRISYALLQSQQSKWHPSSQTVGYDVSIKPVVRRMAGEEISTQDHHRPQDLWE